MMSNQVLCNVSHGNRSSHRSVHAFLTQMRTQQVFKKPSNIPTITVYMSSSISAEYLKPQQSFPHNDCRERSTTSDLAPNMLKLPEIRGIAPYTFRLGCHQSEFYFSSFRVLF